MCSAYDLALVSTSRTMIMSLPLLSTCTAKESLIICKVFPKYLKGLLQDHECKLIFNLRMTAYYGKQWKYLHFHYYIFPVTQMRCLWFRSPVQSVPTFTLCKETASNVKIMLNTPILISCS